MHTQPFNPLTVPIAGTNLIEASAGTGKTYNIAALFTRLIVLEQMPVESVLVVTFTKAATAELKTRLRTRLNEVLTVLESLPDGGFDDIEAALAACCSLHYPGDTFILPLLRQALQQESRARLLLRLKASIGGFDNAAIYTIHGFCQRLLRDYAFLCQVPFDIELTDDNREHLLIYAQDFWREKVSADPQTAQLAFKHRTTPQTAFAAIQPFTNRPYLAFRRPQSNLQAAHTALERHWQQVCRNFNLIESTFWRLFETVLSGTYFKEKSYRELFATLEQAASQNRLPTLSDNDKNDFLKRLENLSDGQLQSKLLKGKTVAAEDAACLNLLAGLGTKLIVAEQAEEDALAALHFDLLQYLADAQDTHKKHRRERGFDDLLLDVYCALTRNPHSQLLAQAASLEWKAALIDEFQDTDPLQYEIFNRLFAARNTPLFLVGDPKQAIYSFRGADIHAYLKASHDAAARYSLDTNHRSHAGLVNSVNALFRLKNRPFVLQGIGYPDVGASRETSRLLPAAEAVRVRWLNRPDEDGTNKDTLRRRAAEYCADEIATALNEAAAGRLNHQKNAESIPAPLQSGQIAVLVRTRNEGQMVAAELKKRGIQSVLLQRESVFATEEAEAVAALLGFWLQPQQTEALCFVLAGVLFRQTAAELQALNHSEAALLAWVDSAQSAAETWQRHGIYAAMQQFSERHGIEPRLLAQGSERSLTNYHQIIERLAEENEQNPTPAALHQWLQAQIRTAQSGKTPSENNLLRLESDENLVKIVTIHAAKGLQYPVVFCPFAWDAKSETKSGGTWQLVHRNGKTELLAPHQPDGADQARISDETLGESLRLLYVALTRAEEQLIIYAAHCRDTPRNPFAYLLEGGRDTTRTETEAAYTAGKKPEQHATLKNNWLRFLENAPESTGFTFTEAAPPETVYRGTPFSDGLFQALALPPRQFETVRHTSFTGLSRQIRADGGSEELRPALDDAETESPAPPASFMPSESQTVNGMAGFPRGADAGVCLHEILEHFDFSAPADEQSGAVGAALARYGFDAHWQTVVETMLDQTRSAPLGGCTLAEVPAEHRRAEMAFTLYMRDFKLTRLQQWFANPENGLPSECAAAARLLDFADVKGFLNGFIDMVCLHPHNRAVLIDYKSNYLGADPEAYGTAAMNEAMAHHHYYLQALIYAVAVARHFHSSGRPLQTVSVRYLFLRGLNGSGNGIWTWDIDTALLAEWLAPHH